MRCDAIVLRSIVIAYGWLSTELLAYLAHTLAFLMAKVCDFYVIPFVFHHKVWPKRSCTNVVNLCGPGSEQTNECLIAGRRDIIVDRSTTESIQMCMCWFYSQLINVLSWNDQSCLSKWLCCGYMQVLFTVAMINRKQRVSFSGFSFNIPLSSCRSYNIHTPRCLLKKHNTLQHHTPYTSTNLIK